MKEKEYFKLTPFKMQVLQSFPFIDADFDALTNYELLCKVVEYLNITIDNINLLNDDFKTLYSYVHDYFDNLDVQEEINNKLDEMALDGTLQEIVASYLNTRAVFGFDTVSDMKLAENLINGSFVETYGFHTVGDGGSAKYKIREVTNEDTVDEITLIALADVSLVAELILTDTMDVKQFGAYGDHTHDDLTSLKTAVDNCNNIVFSEGVYDISNTLYLNSNNHLKGNNAVIYNNSTHPALRAETKDNITVDGLIVRDNSSSNNQHGIYLYGTNLVVKNCIIDNVTGDGIAFGTSKNVLVENCQILNSGRISILAFEGDNVTFRKLYIKGAGHKYTCQFKSCINSTMDDIVIDEGTEISCLSTIQAITENPDPVISRNITIQNIKIINHGKTWTPEDSNLVACLFEGFNYYINNIQIINSYTGAMKLEVSNSVVDGINVNGYGLNGQNNVGVVLTTAEDYGENNSISNIHIEAGTYVGLRSSLKNSVITNINIIDCGTSSQPQFQSADINSIIDNVILQTKSVDCRGLGFAIGVNTASKSKYTNIKRIKAVGHSQYDISGSSLPNDIYIKCTEAVRWNAGRGNITCPFVYDNGIVTMYEWTGGLSGVTPVSGDTVYYDPANKLSNGYFGAYYNGTDWINIIPLS